MIEMIRTFNLKYNGAETEIQIEDKPKAGIVLKIEEMVTKGQTGPNMVLDMKAYFIGLATNLIVKAPWPLQNVDALLNLDYDAFDELCNILGDLFPLTSFLSHRMRLLLGKKYEGLILALQTESTSSASSSDLRSDK